MQPENTNIPNSEVRTEGAPNIPAPSLDRLPPLPSVEAGVTTTGAERVEQVGELRAAQADAASSAVPITQMAQPSIVDDTVAATTPTTGATPLVAENADLIEKEWVDRAKEIVAKTVGDPHAREAQVTALKRDYQQKRFGKGVGAAS